VHFDFVDGHMRIVGMDAFSRLLDRQPLPVNPDDQALLGIDVGTFEGAEGHIGCLDRLLSVR
jgi:hypothetical protein